MSRERGGCFRRGWSPVRNGWLQHSGRADRACGLSCGQVSSLERELGWLAPGLNPSHTSGAQYRGVGVGEGDWDLWTGAGGGLLMEDLWLKVLGNAAHTCGLL